MGRYNGGNSNNSRIGFWIMIWTVWLVIFLIILPQIMCSGDTGCASVPKSNLLYLWWFILTFAGAMPYLDMVFGVWSALLIFGFLDSMD
jgi:hypothetical protein